MGVSVYLIIIIVFVILSFGVWSCIIAYCIYQKCNLKSSRRQNTHVDEFNERRIPAFENQEDLSSISQRPFSITERMEVPPSYEEAIKQNAFHGYSFPTARGAIYETETQRSNLNESSNFTEVQPNPVSLTSNQSSSPQNTTASTSSCRSYPVRNGAAINCASSSLTTISEEFDDSNIPLSVVIDSIGVHSARLLKNCDTSVQLANTDELKSHSKC